MKTMKSIILFVAVLALIACELQASSTQDRKHLDRYQIFGPTIVDTLTGLEWQRRHVGRPLNLKDAITYCSNLELNGGGWRLPTKEELESLLDYSQRPTIDQIAFPETPEEWFWTSTADSGYWAVDFATGLSKSGGWLQEYYVRCVRGEYHPIPETNNLWIAQCIVGNRVFDTLEPGIRELLHPKQGEFESRTEFLARTTAPKRIILRFRPPLGNYSFNEGGFPLAIGLASPRAFFQETFEEWRDDTGIVRRTPEVVTQDAMVLQDESWRSPGQSIPRVGDLPKRIDQRVKWASWIENLEALIEVREQQVARMIRENEQRFYLEIEFELVNEFQSGKYQIGRSGDRRIFAFFTKYVIRIERANFTDGTRAYSVRIKPPSLRQVLSSNRRP